MDSTKTVQNQELDFTLDSDSIDYFTRKPSENKYSELFDEVIELEYLRDNPLEVLKKNDFSEGNLKSKAEYLVADQDSELAEQFMDDLLTDVEKAEGVLDDDSVNLKSTWVDRWGNLMGYDTTEGKAVKVVNDYDEIKKSLTDSDNTTGLYDMIEDAKEVAGGEKEYIQNSVRGFLSGKYNSDMKEWFEEKYHSDSIENLTESKKEIDKEEDTVQRRDSSIYGHLITKGERDLNLHEFEDIIDEVRAENKSDSFLDDLEILANGRERFPKNIEDIPGAFQIGLTKAVKVSETSEGYKLKEI